MECWVQALECCLSFTSATSWSCAANELLTQTLILIVIVGHRPWMVHCLDSKYGGSGVHHVLHQLFSCQGPVKFTCGCRMKLHAGWGDLWWMSKRLHDLELFLFMNSHEYYTTCELVRDITQCTWGIEIHSNKDVRRLQTRSMECNLLLLKYHWNKCSNNVAIVNLQGFWEVRGLKDQCWFQTNNWLNFSTNGW